MTDEALRTLQALGWVLAAAGLGTLLTAAGSLAPEGWVLVLRLGLIVAGGDAPTSATSSAWALLRGAADVDHRDEPYSSSVTE